MACLECRALHPWFRKTSKDTPSAVVWYTCECCVCARNKNTTNTRHKYYNRAKSRSENSAIWLAIWELRLLSLYIIVDQADTGTWHLESKIRGNSDSIPQPFQSNHFSVAVCFRYKFFFLSSLLLQEEEREKVICTTLSDEDISSLRINIRDYKRVLLSPC
jgi:hypothetical protein